MRRYNKFGNQKVIIDGIKFDSKVEGSRYLVLKAAEERGEISDLKLQVRLPIEVDGVKVCTYIADFVYTTAGGQQVIEDVKGVETDVFRLKFKLLAAKGTHITIIKKAGEPVA